jgi:hypothetical protein
MPNGGKAKQTAKPKITIRPKRDLLIICAPLLLHSGFKAV